MTRHWQGREGQGNATQVQDKVLTMQDKTREGKALARRDRVGQGKWQTMLLSITLWKV